MNTLPWIYRRILTGTPFMVLFHQVFIILFMNDFFLARDSFTLDSIPNKNFSQDLQDYSNEVKDIDDRINFLCNNISHHVCKRRSLISKSYRRDDYSKVEFDKLIIIVIDALGSAFIPSISRKHDFRHLHDNAHKDAADATMPFVERLLSNQQALGFIGQAATPTVTMPRIKAIVSGTIPSFIDVIYNLAANSNKFESTNIIELARSQGRQVVFYGDDTWLTLFKRDIFLRSNETFSFFASDYTTVDTNVTANIKSEIERVNEWEIMILHYLGLDHIGHVYGTRMSPLINLKLLEMDNAIKQVYDGISQNSNFSTLILVCGDHGMSDSGNHGGGSELESNTAMIFIPVNHKAQLDTSKISNKTNQPTEDQLLRQVDIAVTISILTGLPIPDKSKGRIIFDIVDALWPTGSSLKTCVSYENAVQLKSLLMPSQLKELSEELLTILELHNREMFSQSSHYLYKKYTSWTRKAQSLLLSSPKSERNCVVVISMIVIILIFITTKLFHTVKAGHDMFIRLYNRFEIVSVILTMIIPILFLSSTDFIEFEPLYWPYFVIAVTCGLYLFKLIEGRTIIKELKTSTALIVLHILMIFMCAHWNKLGIRDASTYLEVYIDSVLQSFSYLLIGFRTSGRDCLTKTNTVLSSSAILIIAIFKNLHHFVGENNNESLEIISNFLAKIVYALIFLDFIYSLFLMTKGGSTKQSSYTGIFIRSWMLFVTLLLRRHNIVLLVNNIILENVTNKLVNSLDGSPMIRVLLYYMMAKNSFYNQGNSNLFPSLDIAPGYIGQSGYNLWVAGYLIMCSAFSLYSFWIVEYFRRHINMDRQRSSVLNHPITKSGIVKKRFLKIDSSLNFMLYMPMLSITFYSLVCTVLRNHLFIWSVISPKLIYEYAFLAYTTLLVQIVLRLFITLDGVAIRDSQMKTVTY